MSLRDLRTRLPRSSVRCGLPTKATTVSLPAAPFKRASAACGDDLTAPLGRRVADHPADLPLAQDLQMRVGLIQQQHGTGVAVHVGKDEEGLLEPAPA